jgi:hypothetical protein
VSKLTGRDLQRMPPANGSPYDEEDMDTGPGMYRQPHNEFLNDRMQQRMDASGPRMSSRRMQDYVFGVDTPQGVTSPEDVYRVHGRSDMQADPEGMDARTSYRQSNQDMNFLMSEAERAGIKIDGRGKWLHTLSKLYPTDGVLETIEGVTGVAPNVNGRDPGYVPRERSQRR